MGRLGAMTHLGMISYQGPTGACASRAQVTLGYKFGGQSDWLITSGPSDCDRKLVSQPCQVVPRPIRTCSVNPHISSCIYRLHMHSTRTAYRNKNEPRLGSQKYLKIIILIMADSRPF